MNLLIWIGAAALLWLVGGVAAAVRSSRSSRWFLVGTIGLGLCCSFLGIIGLATPPLGVVLWTRLLWSTLVLAVPSWVAFSYYFGRGEQGDQIFSLRPVVAAFWAGALVLLGLGLARPPIEFDPEPRTLRLMGAMGRWVVIYALVGLVLSLWNLHATLEAARGARKRRTASAVYALVPLVVTGIFLLADALLYGQQRMAKTTLIVPAVTVSTVAFAVVMWRRRLPEVGSTPGRPVVYSSLVLTALGFLFVTMAGVAHLFRVAGVPPGRWYEPAIAAALIFFFVLTIFPGIREELRGFVDRNLYVSRFEYRTLWQRLNAALSGAGSIDDLADSLHDFLRSIFGPIRVQLWVVDPDRGLYTPIAGEHAQPLGPRDPLVRALTDRPEPLLITGEASRVGEIPLHVACEEMGQRYGLRAFFPIHAAGSLVAILGCGSGGSRVLHPEDIELLRTVTEHLGGVLGVRGWVGAARGPSVAPRAGRDTGGVEA
jgi:hypothetical protein